MSTKPPIPIDEYLRTSYEGADREFRDGAVVERCRPTYSHGRIQLRFGFLFGRLAEKHPLFPASETRLRLGATRVLIPDVAVFSPEPPAEEAPSTPPRIVIEILSPDDRHSEVHQKLAEYRQWGVAHVWLVDPQLRKIYVYDGGLREVAAFELSEPEIQISAGEVFG